MRVLRQPVGIVFFGGGGIGMSELTTDEGGRHARSDEDAGKGMTEAIQRQPAIDAGESEDIGPGLVQLGFGEGGSSPIFGENEIRGAWLADVFPVAQPRTESGLDFDLSPLLSFRAAQASMSFECLLDREHRHPLVDALAPV